MRRRSPLLSLSLSLLATTPAALAVDTWTNPFPGVRRLARVTSSQRVHALLVDLCAAGVSVRVTGPTERSRTPASFGALVGAQAAVNGGFYNTANQSQTDGYVLHDGAAWGGTDHNYTGPIAFGEARAEILPHEQVAGPQPWMREAVEGHPTLVHDGALRDNSGDTGLCGRHPRTAAGLTADRRTLILAVVDGRSPPSRVGMTCNELGAMMAGLGARWALNLDGGGSSSMWLAGAGVLNRPSDGTARSVSNHLAVYARGSGAAAHCPAPAYRAAYVMQTFPLARTTLDLAPGQTSRGYLEMRNTGTATWTPARTRLGTTQPRDRASRVMGPDWLAPNRAAAIDRVVPPGMTGRFNFTLRAPLAAGEYAEYFNLLEEGVAWFSDPAQGGPPDNLIQVRVRTVPVADAGVMAMDAGTRDAGTRDAGTRDAGVRDTGVVRTDLGTMPVDVGTTMGADVGTATPDLGTPVDDGPAPDAPTIDDAGSDDAGDGGSVLAGDAAEAGDVEPTVELPPEGCACGVPGGARSPAGSALAAALIGLVLASRRRLRRRSDRC